MRTMVSSRSLPPRRSAAPLLYARLLKRMYAREYLVAAML